MITLHWCVCSLCGKYIRYDTKDCQCGGPQPDGCVMAQYGFRDRQNKAREDAQKK